MPTFRLLDVSFPIYFPSSQINATIIKLIKSHQNIRPLINSILQQNKQTVPNSECSRLNSNHL